MDDLSRSCAAGSASRPPPRAASARMGRPSPRVRAAGRGRSGPCAAGAGCPRARPRGSRSCTTRTGTPSSPGRPGRGGPPGSARAGPPTRGRPRPCRSGSSRSRARRRRSHAPPPRRPRRSPLRAGRSPERSLDQVLGSVDHARRHPGGPLSGDGSGGLTKQDIATEFTDRLTESARRCVKLEAPCWSRSRLPAERRAPSRAIRSRLRRRIDFSCQTILGSVGLVRARPNRRSNFLAWPRPDRERSTIGMSPNDGIDDLRLRNPLEWPDASSRCFVAGPHSASRWQASRPSSTPLPHSEPPGSTAEQQVNRAVSGDITVIFNAGAGVEQDAWDARHRGVRRRSFRT